MNICCTLRPELPSAVRRNIQQSGLERKKGVYTTLYGFGLRSLGFNRSSLVVLLYHTYKFVSFRDREFGSIFFSSGVFGTYSKGWILHTMTDVPWFGYVPVYCCI